SVNESEEDNNQANDRYKAGEGYHTVPPSYTRNFMPSRPDLTFAGLDDSIFKSAISKTITSMHETETSASTTIITNSGKVPVNIAKQSSLRAATSTSTARYVNTAATRPTVNGEKPSSNVFHKSHSPFRRTFYQRSTPKNNVLKEKINTTKGNLQYTFKDQWIFDSGCSRHMTGNNSFLTDYQEIDGGFVTFGGSPKGVLLKVPRQNNMYSFDLKNVVPSGDHLGKFEGKADEGFLVGYSVKSKEFKVFKSRTKKVEENLHIKFVEDKPNVARWGPEWLFDIDSLTVSMNYESFTAGNQTNNDVEQVFTLVSELDEPKDENAIRAKSVGHSSA
nr:ribonuclease H-like domain-containing protein [Tanacetum cinerariifolium]